MLMQWSEVLSSVDVAVSMAGILGTLMAVVVGLTYLQTTQQQASPTKGDEKASVGRWFPDPVTEPSRYSYEMFVAAYTPLWMFTFGMVVVLQIYESFDAWSYLKLTGMLSAPFLLQPIFFPSAGTNSPDAQRSLWERYAFKANVWIVVYSFIGNYWYTHYFYSVLQASYTMPSIHRLNNVPIAFYLATYFYFSSYHLFSNLLLRKVTTRYQSGWRRSILFVAVVVTFSYLTAFLETISISSYPYYTFQDRNMAYTIGSAFYGIYFLVSFPAFFAWDASVDHKNIPVTSKAKTTTMTTTTTTTTTVWDAVVNSCGYSMIILCLLDWVRLFLDIPLIVGRDPNWICSAASISTSIEVIQDSEQLSIQDSEQLSIQDSEQLSIQ